MDHYRMKTIEQENILVMYGLPSVVTGSGLSRGFYHSGGGPTIQYKDGTKIYCEHGNFHRLDGPAIECCLGNSRYFIHGEELSRRDFLWKTFLQEILQ